jgi:SAM-dependent methyltransferase
MMTTDEGSRRFFDAIASRYDELVSSDPRHAWVREAFQSLVAETVAPGGWLLDFGCGTGTDALWYAERGYRVIAYDNSAAMIAQLRAKCSAQIARGEIIPYHAEYGEFLKQELRPRPVAIVSNFAALSVISDLSRLFAAWAEQVAPPGHIIVNVLNPFFWEEIFRPSWWSDYLRSFGKGMIVRRHENRPKVYEYFPATLAGAAWPYFAKMSHAGVGALVGGRKTHQSWSAPKTLAERLERRYWKTCPVRTIGQFMFIVFSRKSAKGGLPARGPMAYVPAKDRPSPID